MDSTVGVQLDWLTHRGLPEFNTLAAAACCSWGVVVLVKCRFQVEKFGKETQPKPYVILCFLSWWFPSVYSVEGGESAAPAASEAPVLHGLCLHLL